MFCLVASGEMNTKVSHPATTFDAEILGRANKIVYNSTAGRFGRFPDSVSISNLKDYSYRDDKSKEREHCGSTQADEKGDTKRGCA